jgi:hypothetical protein
MINEPVAPEAQSNFGVMLPRPSWAYSDLKYILPLAALTATRIPEAFGIDFRDKVPEPFDVIDHVGNTALTFVIVDTMASGYMGKNPEAMTPKEYERKRRFLAAGVGLTTVALNVLAEKVGYGPTSTPDYLDFIYGCLGGVLAYKIRKPNYISPAEVDVIRETEGPNESLRKFVDKIIQPRIIEEKNKNSVQYEMPSTDSTPQNTTKNTAQSKRQQDSSRSTMQKKSRKQNRKRK